MKRTILTFTIATLLSLSLRAQTTGCNDTINWNQLTFLEGECCWTIPTGSNWEQNYYYNEIISDYDATGDHRLLSPWIRIPSTAAHDSLMLVYSASSYCESEYSLCITTDGVTYDTLYRGLVVGENGYWYYDSIFMGAYAGQTVRLEFCHYCLTSIYDAATLGCDISDPYYTMNMYIDDIQLRAMTLPEVWTSSPDKAFVGDNVQYMAGLYIGSLNGLTYTWHSSLLDSTWVINGNNMQFEWGSYCMTTVVYPTGGIDTLTLVVSNAYGSDTTTLTMTVVDCNVVITDHPWLVDFDANYDCWHTVGSYGWDIGGLNNNTGIVGYGNGDMTIASPAVVLPPDSTGLRLYWKDYRWSNEATYYVMVSTTDRLDLAAYDTLYTGTPGSTSALTQRSVSLADYAGDTVYIAFRQKYQSGRSAFITDVRMYNALVPLGTLEASTTALTVGDTVQYTVHLTQAGDSLLSISWHSTLLDTIFVGTDSLLSVVYSEAGNDTLTVTVSNAYGVLVLRKNATVFGCDTISEFPWNEEFVKIGSAASYNACWEISGEWTHPDANSSYGCFDEDSNHLSLRDFMYAYNTSYSLTTPPIRVPADDNGRLKLWLRFYGELIVTVSTDGGITFDTMYQFSADDYLMRLRSIPLAPYSGQTILARIFPNDYLWLDRVGVDYDSVPRINVAIPAKVYSDSTVLCTATLRYGDTEGLHYSWTSAVGGTFTTNALGDSAWLTYSAGIGGTEDIVTVVADNTFGSNTVTKTVHVIDCSPALTLPWKETFANGTVCWYIPEGSNWHDAIPNGYSYFEYQRYLISHCTSDTIDSWIMSKAIAIPADTNETIRLFWKVASSNSTFVHTYRVMVTTSDNYTDTSVYETLYFDSSTHVNFSNYDTRSISLAQYAGQTIHLAFNNRPVNYADRNVGLYIDDVEVRSARLPIVSLTAPSMVNSHEPVTYTATLNEGSPNGLTYTWRSSLMGQEVVGNRQWELTYTIDGVGNIDTVTVIAANAYGSDTATAVVTVYSCLISSLPWEESFNNMSAVAYNAANGKVPTCWHRSWNGTNSNYAPHVITSYLTGSPITSYCQSNPALLLMAGTSDGYDSVAVVESPFFETALNGQLLSFHYMYESDSNGTLSIGYLQEGTFVSVADIAPQTAGRTDTVILNAFPNDIHRFALQWKQVGDWYGVMVDNLRVSAPDTLPTVRIETSSEAFVGDTATFRAVLTNGLTDGLTYSWHSTLTGLWATGCEQWAIPYTAEGIDTVTVTATNAYGSRVATAVISVGSHPLPQVTLTAPASLTLLGTTTSRTATFTATINDCSSNGLTYTWHSTLTGQWSAGNGQWELEYAAGGIDTVTVMVSNAYGSDSDTAVVTIIDCSNAAVPYYEDFEEVPSEVSNMAGNLPDCWGSTWNGSNAAYAPHVITSDGYQYINNIPNHALFLVAGSSTGYGDRAEVTLPHFAANLQNLSMTLDYRYESATRGTLTVGYYDAEGLFNPVKVLAAHIGNYLRDTVSFADATEPNGQIAIRWDYNYAWYAAIVDNIEVFPDRDIPAPAWLTVDSVSAHCATFSWQPVDNATTYLVSLPEVGDTVVNDTVLTLCNLIEESDYSVRVAALVGNEQGYYTPYTTFTTGVFCSQLAEVTVSTEGIVNWQYDTDGEVSHTGVIVEIIDMLDTALVITDTAYTMPHATTGLVPGHTYTFAIRTLCGNYTARFANSVTKQITPSVCAEETSNTIPSNSRFMDNFWDGNYSQIVYPSSFAASVDTLYGIALRVAQYFPYPWQTTSGACKYDIYVGQTTTTLTSPLTADSLTMVLQNRYFTLEGMGWKDFLFDTPYIYDGQGDLIITIVEHETYSYDPVYGVHTDTSCTHFVQDVNHNGTFTNPVTLNFQWETNPNIPDIRLLGGCGGSVNTCLAPEVEITAVDTHSVSIAWQQRGSEDQWQVEYHVVGDSIWVVADTTATTSYTLTGLQQATHYELRVGSLCNNGIAYGFPDTATTLCGNMELPYTINFLEAEVPCWTIGDQVYHYTWRGLSLSHWSTEDHYIISPQVNQDIANLRAIITSSCGITSDLPRFAVGVSNVDGSEAVWIDTITFMQQNMQQTDEVYFNHYTGNGHYIILQSVHGTSDIMQFTLEPFTGCVPVHEVMVDQVLETTAQVHWIPEDSSHTFALYLDGTLIATTAGTSYSLASLTPNTQYIASVREICGNGDTSIAINCLFETRCDIFALPYEEHFEDAPLIGSERILPDCWILHKDGENADAYCAGDPYSISYMVLSDSYNEGAVNHVCSPRLMAGPTGATVRFKANTNYWDTLYAGIMTDIYDTSTYHQAVTITVNSSGLAWYQFSIDTLGITGPFAVAFRWGGNASGTIDSLIVEEIPIPTYLLTLSVNDSTMGSVTGNGEYQAGSFATITAIPYDGYRFVQWNDSDTHAVRSIKMDYDMSFTAYFETIPDDTTWTVGIGDAESRTSNSEFSIYPNPAHNSVTIQTTEPADVCILDAQGRAILTQTIKQSDRRTITLDISSLPRGVYFVRSLGAVKKLIIQ